MASNFDISLSVNPGNTFLNLLKAKLILLALFLSLALAANLLCWRTSIGGIFGSLEFFCLWGFDTFSLKKVLEVTGVNGEEAGDCGDGVAGDVDGEY